MPFTIFKYHSRHRGGKTNQFSLCQESNSNQPFVMFKKVEREMD